MKKYTFEELVEPFSNDGDSEWFETMQTKDVIKLLKQVRQATLEECAKFATVEKPIKQTQSMAWNNVSPNDYSFFNVDKTTILYLDKDSIEVNE